MANLDPNLKIYLDSIKKTKKLTAKEVAELFNAIHLNRNHIVKSNLRLVVKIAFEMYDVWKQVDIMDLIQEGNIALIHAVDKFEIERGYAFSTLATYRIKGAMLDYIRVNTGPLKIATTKAQRVVFDNLSEIKDELEKAGATLVDVGEKYGFGIDDYNAITANSEPLDDTNLHLAGTTDSVEDIYLKNEARTNLRQKILHFRASLVLEQQFIWDNRIMEKKLTLSECQKPLKMKHTEAVRRLEAKVIDNAKNYFELSDFYDIIGD